MLLLVASVNYYTNPLVVVKKIQMCVITKIRNFTSYYHRAWTIIFATSSLWLSLLNSSQLSNRNLFSYVWSGPPVASIQSFTISVMEYRTKRVGELSRSHLRFHVVLAK